MTAHAGGRRADCLDMAFLNRMETCSIIETWINGNAQSARTLMPTVQVAMRQAREGSAYPPRAIWTVGISHLSTASGRFRRGAFHWSGIHKPSGRKGSPCGVLPLVSPGISNTADRKDRGASASGAIFGRATEDYCARVKITTNKLERSATARVNESSHSRFPAA